MKLRNFAISIHSARIQQGLSVRDVGRLAGIGHATVSRAEQAQNVDILTFERLCIWAKLDPMLFLETTP